MLETSLIVFGIFVLTQIVKRFIAPKFGPTGIHIFVFIVSLIVVGVQVATSYYPGLGEVLLMAGKYLAATLALYEIVWKRLNETLNLG